MIREIGNETGDWETMSCIIVVMPKIEEAGRIGRLLGKYGYRPDLLCTSAAEALSESCRREEGFIICGGRLTDMSFVELQDCIPKSFKLIILSRNVMNVEYPEEAVKIAIPFKASDLIGIIEGETAEYLKIHESLNPERPMRSSEERKYIDRAKAMLIKDRQMTEPEAYRYIQKMSMDSGNSMVETAQMIMLLMR